MYRDLLYQIALTLTPNLGPVQTKLLVEQFGSAEDIFKASLSRLMNIEGIGEVRARSIKGFDQFEAAEEEIRFVEKFNIQPLFLTDKNYPQRLLNCYDTPSLLYYKGSINLNASKVISIVGTRKNTEYGKHVTDNLVRDLASLNVIVVSGLAFGIDAIAHKACLKNNVPTIGVLAHGLDDVYPPHHVGIAMDMMDTGGLLTEFLSRTKPDKYNFPSRNRIVAGLSDATIVIETGNKGGSMITAELANGYNRDVFAFPGKATDQKSAGCNSLIRNNKALLLTDARELIESMGWEENTNRKRDTNKQKALFIELSPDERIIIEILKESESVHIDEINFRSNLSSSMVAAAILNLELQNVIICLPGKRYCLC